MSFFPYKVTAIKRLDATGLNVLPLASVSILTTGGAFATLREADLTTPVGNPFNCDNNGERQVWIGPGSYVASVSGGQSWNFDIRPDNYIQSVATIADLSALTGVTAGRTYYVIGGTLPTLEDGGEFVAIAGSATPDGKNIFSSATAGIYFQRAQQNYGLGIGKAFKNKIELERADVVMLCMGDSTGDATDEWPYVTATKLAAAYPTHSVAFRQWDTGTESFAAPTVISTGTGARTIYVMNGSIAGSTAAYFLGSRRATLYVLTPDLVVFNYGHNMGTDATFEQIHYFHMSAYQEYISDNPTAEYAVTVQNIDTDFLVYTNRQADAIAKVASELGCGVVDVRELFLIKYRNGTLSEWMTDSVHPNATGQEAWSTLLFNSIMEPKKYNCVPQNFLATTQSTGVYNDHFFNWPWDVELPIGYTKNGFVDVSENNSDFETLGKSMQLDSTGIATEIGIVSIDASGALLKMPKSNGITFAARVYPSSGSGAQCGRTEIDLGSAVVTSWPRTEPKGGWYWSSVYITEAQLLAATQMVLRVYSGDLTDVCLVDRFSLSQGRILRDSQFIPVAIDEYYSPANVFGKTVNDVLVITGDVVDVTNTVDAYPGCIINVTDLDIGTSYTATWVTSVSGASSGAYIRSFGGTGAIQQSATPLNAGTITWTAIADTCSIQLEILAVASGTTFELSDISIVRT